MGVVLNPGVWWASRSAVVRRPSTMFKVNNLCGLRIGREDEMGVGGNMPLPKVIALRGLRISVWENTKRLGLYMLHLTGHLELTPALNSPNTIFRTKEKQYPVEEVAHEMSWKWNT